MPRIKIVCPSLLIANALLYGKAVDGVMLGKIATKIRSHVSGVYPRLSGTAIEDAVALNRDIFTVKRGKIVWKRVLGVGDVEQFFNTTLPKNSKRQVVSIIRECMTPSKSV